MSKPVSSLADVQSLAARCIEMADPQLDADFEAKFGLAPADFAALPAQAQQAHLQSHADAAKGAKYAVGNWGHLFGSDRHETNCRIVIDVENGELVAAQEKDGLKFVDLRGERFRDLAESVIEVNEAHNGYLDYGLVLSNELPGWAGGLDNAVSTLQGNVEKPTRGQFVAEVQRRYESGQDNVFEAYRSVYGEPNDDESDLEYVRRCAEQDYADSVYGGCIYQDVIDQWPLIAQGNVSNGQGNVAELAKYVADFESGVIASRGAINDASFDQKRLAASKEAIASGSDHDVKECLNWWAEAIASGSLVQGQGNVATSKDHPDAFFDAQGKLFDWETGDPMPQGWTGIAKRKDTLFVIGQDGEETSYTALYAKTMVDALKEAAARNLLGVQGNVEALQKHGYFAGARDPKVKPEVSGRFMVRDSVDDDGFCIVGDDLNALVLEAVQHLEIPAVVNGKVQESEVDAHEIIVKLADGCTLRSGVYDPGAEGALTAGEYVRLCGPEGEEIHYWDKEEWTTDPALVMGAIMNAAAGHRIQPTVENNASHSPGM